MRIGLFSDTYLPTTNGISYVLDITYRELTKLGHEVFIFTPATNLRGQEPDDPPYVYRFPALEGVFYDEQLTSVFFPPAMMRKIRKFDLDLIHFFTPAQIGLMGIYAAIREDIPLVGQYSTDLFQYVEKYPSVLPGTIALSLTAPFVLKMTPREMIRVLAVFRPTKTITRFHKRMVARMHVALHDRCDAVIALSRKMQIQLDGWGSRTQTTLMPTGVDALPTPTKQAQQAFADKLGLKPTDKVLMYVGRLSKEKNLDLLVDAFEYIAIKDKNAKLVLVGDADYRKELEQRAKVIEQYDRIIFAGRMPRDELGVAYAVADVFLFPSTTDTQGLVIHEAALAGLPLVLCDKDVSEVFIENETGLLAPAGARRFAQTALQLLGDDKLRERLGDNARKLAGKFTEAGQTKKLEQLYLECVENHVSKRRR